MAKSSQDLVRQLNLVGSPCKAQTGSTQKAEIHGVKDPTEGAGSYSEAGKGFYLDFSAALLRIKSKCLSHIGKWTQRVMFFIF